MKFQLFATGALLALGLSAASAQQAAGSRQVPLSAKPGEVAMVGCLQREADYRAAAGRSAGGVLGTGIGTGNEYVLAKARPIAASATEPSKAVAARDFSLTGSLEKDLAREVGRLVQVVGTLKEEEGKLPLLTVSLSHAVGDFCPSSQEP
jgi:hypothetical protein